MTSRATGRSVADEAVDVLVVGAGPTGLTAAVLLARSGVRVAVVERDSGPIDQSRALLVHPRTLELWRPLGIVDEALRRGRVFDRIDVHVTGRPRGKLYYDGAGISPFRSGLVLEQSATQRLLLDRLSALGLQPSWSCTVTSLVDDDSGVTATVETPGRGTSTIRARYVIGADGAASTVRESTGLVLAGRTYDSSFFLADLVLRTPLAPSRLHLSVTGTHFHAFFPMPGEGRWRVIGTLDPAQVDRYTERYDIGKRTGVPAADIRDIVATSRMPVRVEEVGWASTYRIHQRIVERYRVGRRFLAGDAAHIHSPAGGQGMNTGVADAVNLAWKLAAVITGQADEVLLDSYDAERRPAAQAVLDSSDRLFRLEASTSPVAGWARSRVLPLVSFVLSSTDAGRRALFGQLAQTRVTYRGAGPAAPARATGSRVRAGDRLPHVPLDDGRTTHDLVDATRHALLVVADRRRPGDEVAAARLEEVVSAAGLAVAQHLVVPAGPGLRPAARDGEAVALLVRPDGHVAHAGPVDDAEGLRRHLGRAYGSRGPARPAAAPAALPAPGRYRLDPGSVRIRFRTRHLFGLGVVDGRFALDGPAELVVTDGPTGPGLVVDLRIAASSFTTGDARRDRDVRGRRFLDADAFPAIGVRLDGVESRGSGHRLRGTLTVRGATAPLAVDVDELVATGDGFRARATARIDRHAHGVTAAPGMAARRLDVTIDVLARHATAPDPRTDLALAGPQESPRGAA